MLRVEVPDASNATWLRGEGRFVGAFAEDGRGSRLQRCLPSAMRPKCIGTEKR